MDAFLNAFGYLRYLSTFGYLRTLGTLCSAEAQGESSKYMRETQPEGGREIAHAMGGLKQVSCSQSHVSKPAVRATHSLWC